MQLAHMALVHSTPPPLGLSTSMYVFSCQSDVAAILPPQPTPPSLFPVASSVHSEPSSSAAHSSSCGASR